ncbi:N-acetylglucosamine-6-phosphate deacetylase [Paracoccus aurantiacus]|uniref:N-acetylglucosamine-6-phosphate deacetylase n=1 Tax=Paracoccus aurantiacus TaxID=2599412 RepID=A0A5C6S3U4_9RHOB|nr:N-acetylglucosamine-6-phosphate deacetylase [Paracoccus aurantiacus]TXB69280.1 N-acetylglucosamine-6-phosphate deacetylase [Paracoccus aurantiacus]
MEQTVFHAERIFDGDAWHDDAALILRDGKVDAIEASASLPEGKRVPGWIVPGLIDLQVNGGGGVLLNNDPTPSGIAQICASHMACGTTGIMATLITDTPEVTARAVEAAASSDATGLIGLHLEGPHLDASRKGTHDPALIRPMTAHDLGLLVAAAKRVPHLIVTVAPEAITPQQVAALADAGITVSLGHSDCDAAAAGTAFDAGARMVTHLFNAMSQLAHRAPGLVGAALDDGRVWAGLIADGFHVDDAAMRVALRGKAGPGRMFLVSDAMSTIGTDLEGFSLNGRRIYRKDGRLTLADGTLAGADIALIDAVRYVHRSLGLPLAEALQLASLFPAEAMRLPDRGHLRPGARADFLTLTPDIAVGEVWSRGRRVGQGSGQIT